MSDIFLLYIFTRVDSVASAMIALTFLFTLLSAIWWMARCGAFTTYAMSDDNKMAFSKTSKRFAVASMVCLALSVAIPSQKDLMFILAGVGVLEVAKSETAQRLAGKSVQVIEQYLDGLVDKTEVK